MHNILYREVTHAVILPRWLDYQLFTIVVAVCIIMNLITQYEYHYMSEYIMSMQHSQLHMWTISTLYKCAMVSWMLTRLQS